MATGRNTSISICKAIAIILMVIGHADAPRLLTNFIYLFHMPLFFIAAGYFFNRKYLDDPWPFIQKRFKSLYFPFLKWSIFFLILHNLWFKLGILNEEFGNWSGSVTHPYTLKSAATRLVMMITGMAGYDEFMAGAFWFFRGLFLASILFLLLYKLIDSKTKFSPAVAVAIICVAMVAFTAFRIQFGVKITTIPNGGWRETWGIFFFGIGVLYRSFEKRIPQHWALSLLFFGLLCAGAYLHFSGMNNGAKPLDLITLPLTGIIGFLLTKHIADSIDRHDNRFRRLLIFIGDNTLYIFIFHIISFKLVSLLKIWYYDLPFAQIGCHMVIHYKNDDLFWILYSLVGMALPMLWIATYRRIKKPLSLTFKKF